MPHKGVTLFSALPFALGFPGKDSLASDRALIARLRNRDRRAFQKIFERHVGPVRAFLRDMLADASAADEGTQEVFFRAYRRSESLRDGEKLLPWLLGIARNVSLEQLRARQREAGSQPIHSSDQEDDDKSFVPLALLGPTPESLLLERETEERFARALGRLSENRRAALLFRIDHALSYEEISELMGWSLPKVKIELHRARAQLRESLASEDGGR